MWESLKTFGISCLDFLIPQTCCDCQTPLSESTTTRAVFCQNCIKKLPEPLTDVCQVCSAPTGPYVIAEQGCRRCRGSRLAFDQAISLGVHNDELRRMVLLGKQPRRHALVAALTDLLWERQQQRLKSWKCDAIVPVPMYWFDRLQRQVHPNETVADVLAGRLKLPVMQNLLRQKRQLPKQSHLSVHQRRQAIHEAYFCCKTDKISGKALLLVDDVLTTGATASECARQLLSRGAKQVFVAVLARGTGDNAAHLTNHQPPAPL